MADHHNRSICKHSLALGFACLPNAISSCEVASAAVKAAHRDLVKVWEKVNEGRFDKIMCKAKTMGTEALPAGTNVRLESTDGSNSEGLYHIVL